MKIAHCVESYAPSMGGMPEVVKQISERLALRGHDVTVLTSFHKLRNFDVLRGVRIKSFKITGNAISGIVGNTDEYIQELKYGNYDVVAFFAAQQWATDVALTKLASFPFKKIFIPTGFSALYDVEWKDYYDRMPQWLHQMDMNVFLSDDYRDVNLAKLHGVERRMLIPNGASEEEFEYAHDNQFRAALKIPNEHFLILHVGSFIASKAQWETANLFLNSNLKNATLLMIGNGAETFWKKFARYPLILFKKIIQRVIFDKRIKYLSTDRWQTVEAYKAANLFLFPSKIECSPIVLFEAMAAGTPFLCTDVGNAKEIAQWSGAGWILPTQKTEEGTSEVIMNASIEILNTVAPNKERLLEASKKGRAAWQKHFTWRTIAERYEELYRQLTNVQ